MEVNHFITNIGELRTDDSIQDHVMDLKPNFSQLPVVGNEKSEVKTLLIQCMNQCQENLFLDGRKSFYNKYW